MLSTVTILRKSFDGGGATSLLDFRCFMKKTTRISAEY